MLFDQKKCAVIKIGDADQAIYNSAENVTSDWVPETGYLPIASSNRYGQEIADVLCKLRSGKEPISTFAGCTNIKPVLLVFDIEKIDRVLGGFINALETHGLNDPNGVYKAIGAIKKEDAAGLKIGSYWSEFDGSRKKQDDYNYWTMIDEIRSELIAGRLYKAERIIRGLLCRVFHYAKVRHPETGKEFTITTIKKVLDDEYDEIYRDRIYGLSQLQDFETETISSFIQNLVNELLEVKNPGMEDIFRDLPAHFMNQPILEERQVSEKNVFIDPIRGRRIEFNTIHGVKGETHDAPCIWRRIDRAILI